MLAQVSYNHGAMPWTLGWRFTKTFCRGKCNILRCTDGWAVGRQLGWCCGESSGHSLPSTSGAYCRIHHVRATCHARLGCEKDDINSQNYSLVLGPSPLNSPNAACKFRAALHRKTYNTFMCKLVWGAWEIVIFFQNIINVIDGHWFTYTWPFHVILVSSLKISCLFT